MAEHSFNPSAARIQEWMLRQHDNHQLELHVKQKNLLWSATMKRRTFGGGLDNLQREEATSLDLALWKLARRLK